MTHRITSQKSTFKGVCFLPNGHDGECCHIVSQRQTYIGKKVADLCQGCGLKTAKPARRRDPLGVLCDDCDSGPVSFA